MTKPPKRRIQFNIWGNWNGYEGTRKVHEFGESEQAARRWLAGEEIEKAPTGPIVLRRFDFPAGH